MMFKEMQEAEEIFKEEALKKIKELVNRYQLTQFDVLSIFANNYKDKSYIDEMPSFKNFDPFFDAW